MPKNPKGRLPYGPFLDELVQVQGRTKPDIARAIGAKVTAVYDFFDARSKPNAGLAKAVEAEMGVNLPAWYYGWGSVMKP